mgnify:CR=1 FL=1
MPSCVGCRNFVAIDADACPQCGGKQKYDLDDSERAEWEAEQEELGRKIDNHNILTILFIFGFPAVCWYLGGATLGITIFVCAGVVFKGSSSDE